MQSSASSAHRASLLILADGRIPTGGYAHSNGLEQAVRQGWVTDLEDVRNFLVGRISTTASMNAAFAARAYTACALPDPAQRDAELTTLNAELLARTPAPALRQLGEWLGKLMARSLRSMLPKDTPDFGQLPKNLQQPLVFGAAAYWLGLDARDAASAVVHEAVTGPAIAAVKILAVDPFALHRVIFELADHMDATADQAAVFATAEPRDLPALSSPMSDFSAELHARDDVRLFAS